MKYRIKHIRVNRLLGLHPLLSEYMTAGHLNYAFDRDLITAEAVQALLRANPIPAVHKEGSRDEWWALARPRYVQLARLSLGDAASIPVQAFKALSEQEVREVIWAHLYLDPLISIRERGSEYRLLERARARLPASLTQEWHPNVTSQRTFATALGVDRRSLSQTERHHHPESTWERIRREASERG